MKRLEDLSTQELADLLHVSDMEAQKLLESAGPFMQTPVQEVREELRRLRNSLQPDKIPHDVANRWKQIRDLLYREPEFEIRYPAAYGLLMEPYYPEIMDELGGLSLPSFGGRIFRHDPHEQVNYSREPGEHYDAFTTRHSGGEAKGPLLKHEFEPLDLGYLQGILFEVLGRDEYWERLHKRSRDPDLILRYGAPDKSLIRLTDLRLARKLVAELKSEKFPPVHLPVMEWQGRLVLFALCLATREPKKEMKIPCPTSVSSSKTTKEILSLAPRSGSTNSKASARLSIRSSGPRRSSRGRLCPRSNTPCSKEPSSASSLIGGKKQDLPPPAP
jgi:hypothetical protein